MGQDNLEDKDDKEGRRKNRNKEGILLRILLRAAGILMAAGAVLYIGKVLLEDRRGEEEYLNLRRQVMERAENESTLEQAGDEAGGYSDIPLVPVSERAVCSQVARLQEENAEVAGWIDFGSLQIGYPVMQGEDNEKYLIRTYSGEYNRAGSIFMEASNSEDFEDSHTIIYGHNMGNGSMFGKLKKYRDKDFYKEHPVFMIYTRDKVMEYEIFAYYDIPEDGDIYDVSFADAAEFEELVQGMLKRRYYDTKVIVSAQDKVVTLSTCSKEGERFVVHGKQAENREVVGE